MMKRMMGSERDDGEESNQIFRSNQKNPNHRIYSFDVLREWMKRYNERPKQKNREPNRELKVTRNGLFLSIPFDSEIGWQSSIVS